MYTVFCFVFWVFWGGCLFFVYMFNMIKSLPIISDKKQRHGGKM